MFKYLPQSLSTDGDLSFGNLSSLAFSLDVNSLFGGVHLDVGLAAEVRADSSVGSVCSSASLGGSIDLNVVNDEVLHILSVSVGFDVVNETEDDSDWFLWPSSESFSELWGLTGSADATEVLGVRNTSSVGKDVLEILFSFGDSEALDGLSSLVGVLIMDAEVFAWSLGD